MFVFSVTAVEACSELKQTVNTDQISDKSGNGIISSFTAESNQLPYKIDLDPSEGCLYKVAIEDSSGTEVAWELSTQESTTFRTLKTPQSLVDNNEYRIHIWANEGCTFGGSDGKLFYTLYLSSDGEACTLTGDCTINNDKTCTSHGVLYDKLYCTSAGKAVGYVCDSNDDCVEDVTPCDDYGCDADNKFCAVTDVCGNGVCSEGEVCFTKGVDKEPDTGCLDCGKCAVDEEPVEIDETDTPEVSDTTDTAGGAICNVIDTFTSKKDLDDIKRNSPTARSSYKKADGLAQRVRYDVSTTSFTEFEGEKYIEVEYDYYVDDRQRDSVRLMWNDDEPSVDDTVSRKSTPYRIFTYVNGELVDTFEFCAYRAGQGINRDEGKYMPLRIADNCGVDALYIQEKTWEKHTIKVNAADVGGALDKVEIAIGSYSVDQRNDRAAGIHSSRADQTLIKDIRVAQSTCTEDVFVGFGGLPTENNVFRAFVGLIIVVIGFGIWKFTKKPKSRRSRKRR